MVCSEFEPTAAGLRLRQSHWVIAQYRLSLTLLLTSWELFNPISYQWTINNLQPREVVVAQLVEQPLLIPEVRGSDPVIGKIYIDQLFTINCIEKKKINKKRPGMAHF